MYYSDVYNCAHVSFWSRERVLRSVPEPTSVGSLTHALTHSRTHALTHSRMSGISPIIRAFEVADVLLTAGQ